MYSGKIAVPPGGGGIHKQVNDKKLYPAKISVREFCVADNM
jgi:hypothetical protein